MSDSNVAEASMGHRAMGRKANRRWADLSPRARSRIIAQGAIQVALTGWTLWDLSHRPADKVNGNKRWWAVGAFTQPFGPIAYLLFGRKRK